MRYVSPAWLFNGHLPDPLDNKALRLRRTQLLADIELTGITIEYHGEIFTKNDVISLFDELETEDALKWHHAVARDKTLFSFLQDIHFDDWAVEQHCVSYQKNPLYENEAFIQWLSPYYYDSFIFYMEMNCLKASNAHALIALLGVPLLMTRADQEKAWQAAILLIDRRIDLIRRCGAEATSETELARAGVWMEEGFLQLVHLLPEDHFGPVRDRYAQTIFEACANVRRSSRRFPRLTTLWMENAIALSHSPQLRHQLERSRKQMYRLGEPVRRFKDIPARVWIIIIAVFLLYIWIARKSH